MKKTRIINTNELQNYLKDLKKIPVITHERQDEIFKKLKDKNITKQEKEKLHNELVVEIYDLLFRSKNNTKKQGMDFRSYF